MDNSNYKRTTLYIHKQLWSRAKVMAALCETSVSHLVSIALKEKLEKLKKEKNITG